MSLCVLDNLATAIAAELAAPANAAEFGNVAFTVSRISHLEFDPLTLPGIQLFVWGADERRNVDSRGRTEREWDIHVGIVKRLAADTNAEVDPLRLLVERVADFFEFRQPADIVDQRWAGIEIVNCIPELVKELTFIGVVRLTYKGERT